MTKVWVDAKSPSDVHVLIGLMRALPSFEFEFTVRDRAEAVGLAEDYGSSFEAVGRDSAWLPQKVFNYGSRIWKLNREIDNFDFSISFNNMNAVLLSRLKGKPSITLMDNDLEFDATQWSLPKRLEMAVNLRADWIICPDVMPLEKMISMGADECSIVSFPGYKEDLYTANFTPSEDFKKRIPFDRFVVVRPESRSAVYVRERKSIVPSLLRLLEAEGRSVVYLPRVNKDREAIPEGSSHIWSPDKPLNGLQLCHHAEAVLTGSGSLAREAACLGTKAISFFPGRLLAVDQDMVEKNRILHTRDPSEAVQHAIDESNPEPAPARKVRDEVCEKIKEIIRPQAGG